MARPSRDWRALFVRYQKQKLKSGITIKDWCSRNKIPYSLCRKNFSKIRAEMTAEADQIGNSDHNSSDLANNDLDATSEIESSEISKTQNGVRPIGAPKGNKNAFIHGVYESLYGKDLWAASKDMSREFRYLSMNAKMLRADSKASEYLNEANRLQMIIASEGRQPTEEESKRLKSLDSRIESSLVASSMVNSQIESMDTNVLNREYTKAATIKTNADTRRIKSATRKLDAESIKLDRENEDRELDRGNKKLQGDLLAANIEKTKKQTELTAAQLKALDKGDGRDHDDIYQILDEIMDERDPLMRDIPEDY